MMKQATIEKTAVGIVVILIILWILFSVSALNFGAGVGEFLFIGLLNLMQLFILSLVCTLGISLIIWLPLGYGVGWIVYKIAGWDRVFHKKQADTQKPEPQIEGSPTRDQQALLNYIKKARSKGLNDDQISQKLTTNGWPTDSITAAFQMAGNGV